ncbi:ABC transporter ATP-binding protein [Salinibacterium sp. G-O1]|uniref:ABC transporter ATP-binding protein n=1 Tax=Salinibacterium sp. G-O1 TaxID=3046208 RepID=UPI0024B9CAA2|nr:ABC transporter ATP-binding protein [Salinibacterium sp. G-O1]MDJ0333984.1 ABC transporter ATP-binding protein [Salinibacterium sp. G-O1]
MTSQQNPPALLATGLVRRFGDRLAVDNVDVTVHTGTLTAILGPSGCGKSTVLRMVAGLEHPDAGTVSLSGTLVQAPGHHVPPERRGVGLVFQDNVLFPHLTIAENIGYGVRRDQRTASTTRLLDLVGLGDVGQRMPHEVSGGQQQRAALARTLATSPRIILLDEPFSQLDAHLRERVRSDMVDAIRRTDSTALLVTHDQDEAFELADEVIVMSEGRIHQVGSPQQIYQRPADRFVAEFVGHATLVPAIRVADGVVDTTVGRLAVRGASAESTSFAVLRPESVVVGSPEDRELGAQHAQIMRVRFQGMNHLVDLKRDDGMHLVARVPGLVPCETGDLVSFRVHGPVATV